MNYKDYLLQNREQLISDGFDIDDKGHLVQQALSTIIYQKDNLRFSNNYYGKVPRDKRTYEGKEDQEK